MIELQLLDNLLFLVDNTLYLDTCILKHWSFRRGISALKAARRAKLNTTQMKYIKLAKALFYKNTEIEIDENLIISLTALMYCDLNLNNKIDSYQVRIDNTRLSQKALTYPKILDSICTAAIQLFHPRSQPIKEIEEKRIGCFYGCKKQAKDLCLGMQTVYNRFLYD